jgi:TolA-binding protein
MKVTNNSKAPQGVHTVGGLQWVPPGESRELAVSAADAAQIAKLGFLEIDGDPVDDKSLFAFAAPLLPSIDIPDNEVDQLRQQVDALNTSVTDMAEALLAKGQEIERLNDLLTEREAEIADLKAKAADDADQSGAVPAGPYEVKETSAGWFGIFGANGEQIGKNMRSGDAETFKSMSPEDQAAYLSPTGDKS